MPCASFVDAQFTCPVIKVLHSDIGTSWVRLCVCVCVCLSSCACVCGVYTGVCLCLCEFCVAVCPCGNSELHEFCASIVGARHLEVYGVSAGRGPSHRGVARYRGVL